MPDATAVAVREPHKRVRLEGLEDLQLPDGHWVGRVVVAWQPGSDFVGTAKGPDSAQGQLRCAAEATARALERATGNKVVLQVLAVSAMEGFDTVLVVVSLEAPDLVERLVGSCLIKEQPSRAAALAVLHATNRLLRTVVTEGSGQRRFRLRPGQYAHGIAWCNPGEIYKGEIVPGQTDRVRVFAPAESDRPRSADLPLVWFEEVAE